jgi:hypothetical protein
MMATNGIRDRIPKRQESGRLVQAFIPSPLREKVEAQIDRDKISWKALIIASFEQYLAEAEKKKAR